MDIDHQYWHQKWANGDIGFHEAQANALLRRHLGELGLNPGMRIFLPLCGKTRDIGWLLRAGFQVAGAELSERAVSELFAELGLDPVRTPDGALVRHSAPGIDIWVGDLFAMGAAQTDGQATPLGRIDAVYDRAALVALPPGMRARYAAHVAALCARAPQLLISFEYDQQLMDGPPYAIGEAQLLACYAQDYKLALLERAEVSGGLKGRVAACETAWLLT